MHSMRLVTLVLVLSSAVADVPASIAPVADLPTSERSFDGTLAGVGSVDADPRVFGTTSGQIALLAREDFRLVARRSVDGGATFGAEVTLGGDTPPDVLDYDAAWNGASSVYVAMVVADATGGVGLRFTRSDDMGATWAAPVAVVDDASPAHGVLGVRIAAGPSGTAAVAIRGNSGRDAFVAATADDGATWTTPVRIDAAVPAGSAPVPAVDVAIDGGSRIHAVFTQNRGSGDRVFFSRSTNGGTSFSAEFEVPLAAAGRSANPDVGVAQDGNVLLALWDRSDVDRVYVLRSIDQGASFTTVLTRLVVNFGSVLRPSLVIDPAAATTFLLYVDGANALQVERSTNAGLTWGASPTALTTTASGFFSEGDSDPVVFMRRTSPGNWVVAWTDRGADAYARARWDVYARATTNDGTSYGAAARADSGTAGAAFSRLTGMTAYGANNVFLAYADGRNDAGKSANVFGNRSAVPLAFAADVRLDTDAGVRTPDTGLSNTVAIDGAGHVYYAFTARDTGPFDDVFVAVSADSGKTFAAPLRVGSVAAGSRLNRNPILKALPDGHVYLLYQSDASPATREFRFTRSSDFGGTWSTPDRVVGSIPVVTGSDDDARVSQRLEANAAGVVYVVWSNVTSVQMARSVDFGANFAAPVAIDDDPFNNAVYPFVCASGTQLVVTYYAFNAGSTSFTVWARVSQTSGAAFQPAIDLRSGTVAAFALGGLACGPGSAVVALWPDLRSGPAKIYARRFDGTNWSAESIVASPADLDVRSPDGEFVDPSTVLVTFEDGTGVDEVHVARSTDGGATFSSFVRVDDAMPSPSALSNVPRVTTDGAGNAWVRFLDAGTELPSIVARFSGDGGQTFGPPLRVHRELPQGSRVNSIAPFNLLGRDLAASGGVAHFAWTGQRATFEEDALYNRWNSADLDEDGTASTIDCDDRNPGLFLSPVEIDGVAVSRIVGGIRIAWGSQDAAAGPETVYDLVSGVLADLRASGDYAAAWCLSSGVADTPYDDLSADPAPGGARYFLVRARNACASGTHGDSTLGADPRDGLDAGSPCP